MRNSVPRSALRAFMLCALFVAPAFPQGADMGMGLPETAPEEGFSEHRKLARETAHRLICFCGCERMTLDDCGCGFAFEQVGRIESLLKDGKTPDEVVALYVAEHGEKVLSSPPARGFNLLAWVIPFAGLAAGIFILLFIVRRMTRRAPTQASEETARAPVELSPEMLARVERELKEWRE